MIWLHGYCCLAAQNINIHRKSKSCPSQSLTSSWSSKSSISSTSTTSRSPDRSSNLSRDRPEPSVIVSTAPGRSKWSFFLRSSGHTFYYVSRPLFHVYSFIVIKKTAGSRASGRKRFRPRRPVPAGLQPGSLIRAAVRERATRPRSRPFPLRPGYFGSNGIDAIHANPFAAAASLVGSLGTSIKFLTATHSAPVRDVLDPIQKNLRRSP